MHVIVFASHTIGAAGERGVGGCTEVINQPREEGRKFNDFWSMSHGTVLLLWSL